MMMTMMMIIIIIIIIIISMLNPNITRIMMNHENPQ